MPSSEVTIVKAVQTCYACPSQWDAWDSEGNYWYLRFRWGTGTAEQQPSPDIGTWENNAPEFMFDYGDSYAGVISLQEFCELAGIGLDLK